LRKIWLEEVYAKFQICLEKQDKEQSPCIDKKQRYGDHRSPPVSINVTNNHNPAPFFGLYVTIFMIAT